MSTRTKPARRVVVHLSRTRPGPFGGTVTGSICGRSRTLADGMNLTGRWSEVTCKFCLRKRARPSHGE